MWLLTGKSGRRLNQKSILIICWDLLKYLKPEDADRKFYIPIMSMIYISVIFLLVTVITDLTKSNLIIADLAGLFYY